MVIFSRFPVTHPRQQLVAAWHADPATGRIECRWIIQRNTHEP